MLKCTCDFSSFLVLIKIYVAYRVKNRFEINIQASEFKTYLLPIFIIVKFFKVYTQLTINPMSMHRCFQNET